MKEKKLIQYLILIHWTLFSATTVIDKIVPDVYPLWVGADFYTLFVKFFASLGVTDPIFATIALAGVSFLEIVAFVCFAFSLFNLYKSKDNIAEQWFYRGISFSILTFSLFSIGDQVFGDRFTLLEHTIFWIILVVSWVVYKYNTLTEERQVQFSLTNDLKMGLLVGTILTALTSYSIVDFSKSTFANKTKPVQGDEVVEGVYKFDLPFLGDKFTMENTIKSFEEKHPNLKIKYVYTGPDELNSKKKTHILLYVFTERSTEK
ncbi:MAG: hypothetical protein U5L45_14025 [Saprospiraceae bacterium]|nr:hypothetical protein [Saprospiraceae bacterium]